MSSDFDAGADDVIENAEVLSWSTLADRLSLLSAIFGLRRRSSEKRVRITVLMSHFKQVA